VEEVGEGVKQHQPTLFDGDRMGFDEALELTAVSLRAYALRYRHWAIAYSGGKDSSATLTVVLHLIWSGQIPAPLTLTVLFSDTRMELTPLWLAAMEMLKAIEARGITVKIVLPKMDDRFFVYMFGRGVPPPSNTFRWCTSQLKIEPMLAALKDLRDQAGEKLLMLTGVRLGESAARDARIALSCGKNGSECGQGWFQEATPTAIADTLAALLHWRVCFVWDWLMWFAPEYGFPQTRLVAEAYGGDEAEEVNARTGCIQCNLASDDRAFRVIVQNPKWERLKPLKELKALYGWLKLPVQRIRKDGTETRKDGSLVANPCRMGPLTFESRREGLRLVKDIQARAGVDLINAEEESRILELIEARTWPRGWDGTEPLASLPFDNVNPDGSIQPIMRALLTT
jgi:DNA sulfur modification protein DndC